MNPGDVVGHYRIVRRLALGEHSEVLLAHAQGPFGFWRTVVLKRLIGRHARDPQWLRRLAAEAIACARLTDDAVLRLYDFVVLDGTPVLVLEYVPGVSLEALLWAKREPGGERVARDVALYVGSRIFAALAAAHDARHPESGEFSPVVHRDVNPSNVLLSTQGYVKLTNFGIARVSGVTDLTPSGTLLGTYGYMAPEQILGGSINVRTDVYAAALVVWELLAHRRAFDTSGLPELELLQAMAVPDLPPIEMLRADVPPAVAKALGRALRRSSDERMAARDLSNVLAAHIDASRARALLAQGVVRLHRPSWPSVDPGGGNRTAELPALVASKPPAGMRYDSGTHTALVRAPLQAAARARPRRTRRAAWVNGSLAASAALALFGIVLRHGDPALDATAFGGPRAQCRRHPERPTVRTRVDEARMDALAEAAHGPADTGVLQTPASMWNHRMFVDGVVRGVGGDAIPVSCGRHTVRLGSAGRLQVVGVPCGDRVVVVP